MNHDTFLNQRSYASDGATSWRGNANGKNGKNAGMTKRNYGALVNVHRSSLDAPRYGIHGV